MRLGLANAENVFSYSSCQQAVEIPPGAAEAELSFHYLPLMALAGEDRIYFCVLDADTDLALYCDIWSNPNPTWQRGTYNLVGYAGMRIKVHFGVRNDGTGAVSTMYLDDVELWVR